MQTKAYHIPDNKTVGTYNSVYPVLENFYSPKNSNPNIPFQATQEEWWEHIHSIEEGNFTQLEEANREFDIWRKEYLASQLK